MEHIEQILSGSRDFAVATLVAKYQPDDPYLKLAQRTLSNFVWEDTQWWDDPSEQRSLYLELALLRCSGVSSERLIEVRTEVRRHLRHTSTCCCNLEEISAVVSQHLSPPPTTVN